MNYNGVINVLKPPGISSHGVVSQIKKRFKTKVGHTGTLDPGAAGVLPVVLGSSTKLIQFINEEKKEYYFEILLGVKSDTGDAFGKVTKVTTQYPSREEILKVLEEFHGNITQIPPMTSAIKVDGQKLYKLARKNIEVQVPSRVITIYSIELLNKLDENRYICKTLCSKGTYIRTLCIDIGERLGCGAIMSFLLRTKSGPFNIEDSTILEEINDKSIISVDPFINLPEILINENNLQLIKNGQPIYTPTELPNNSEVKIKLIKSKDSIVAIGKYDFEKKTIYPKKVLV